MTGIVVGSAPCVWNDLSRIPKAVRDQAVWYAVNEMIVFSPTVHHAVSHHRIKLPHWFALRTRDGHRGPREPNIVTHSSQPGPGVDKAWTEFRYGGSSSLLAARIALETCGRVLLVGVPLDHSGYLWGDPQAMRHNYDHFRKAWIDIAPLIRSRVVALSGFLVSVLGEYKP